MCSCFHGRHLGADTGQAGNRKGRAV
jgi:hypothetical protein